MYLSSKKIFSTAAAEVDCSTCMECPAQIGERRWAEMLNLVFGDSRERFEESFKAQDAKWHNKLEPFAVQPQPVFCGPPMHPGSHLCGLPFVPQPFAFEFMVMPLLDTPVQAIPQVLPSTSPCSEVASPCMSCRGSFGPADNVTLVEEPGQHNSNAGRTCKHGILVCNFRERELATRGKNKCKCRKIGGEEALKKFCHVDECVRLWNKKKTARR